MTSAEKNNECEISCFTSNRFISAGDRVVHGFTGRNGGVSPGIYTSLNTGRGSDDNPANVKENYKIVAQFFGIQAQNILTLHQVHGDTCLNVTEGWNENARPEADAFVTDRAGIALGVLTADCAPVLFTAEKKDGTPVIGAAHAGWKGAIGGILESTVETMRAYDIKEDSLRAAIGPCIAQTSYEVDEGFFRKFCEDDEGNEKFFKNAQKENHYMFDLPGYCAARLAQSGLKNVFIKDLDTYFNEEDFYSYRRATHRAESDYGRQISLIVIREESKA